MAPERIDPLGQPTVTAGSDHRFRTCCPYVRTFQNPAKQTKFQAKSNAHYWRDCGSGRVDH